MNSRLKHFLAAAAVALAMNAGSAMARNSRRPQHGQRGGPTAPSPNPPGDPPPAPSATGSVPKLALPPTALEHLNTRLFTPLAPLHTLQPQRLAPGVLAGTTGTTGSPGTTGTAPGMSAAVTPRAPAVRAPTPIAHPTLMAHPMIVPRR